jgi:hypothetical protein
MRSIVLMAALVGCGGTNNNNNSVETCTQALCPSGGHTYRFCSAPQATACRYLGSDGTIFNCVSCSNCMAAADAVSTWCATGQGPTTTTSTTGGVPDFATKPIHDLALPANGCNGLVNCLQTCSDSTCEDGCIAAATDRALTLLNQAFYFCPATKFCGPGTHSDAGAGAQACNSTDLDPNVTYAAPNFAQPSDACNNCLDEFFAMSTAQTTFMSQCASDITACTNDKP